MGWAKSPEVVEVSWSSAAFLGGSNTVVVPSLYLVVLFGFVRLCVS